MNKDNNSDCILLLLFYERWYSLYINKAVDEKSQQIEACCVWRAKGFQISFNAKISTGTASTDCDSIWMPKGFKSPLFQRGRRMFSSICMKEIHWKMDKLFNIKASSTLIGIYSEFICLYSVLCISTTSDII